MKIIANIDIRPTIEVDIAHCNPQAIPQRITLNTRVLCHIHKHITVIAHQAITSGRMAFTFVSLFVSKGAILVYRMVKLVHIQIPVKIVIKKSCLGRKPNQIQPILICPVFKNRNSLFISPQINVELIFSPEADIIT